MLVSVGLPVLEGVTQAGGRDEVRAPVFNEEARDVAITLEVLGLQGNAQK